MQRFFIEHPLKEVEIFENELHHQISRVLRMQINEGVILFSGDGREFLYSIKEINKKQSILAQKEEIFIKDTEPNIYITLYQALPNKLEKIEWIIQKNIEIGISKIIFFRSDHSQKLLLSDNKIKRLHAIARESLEQCGWKIYPEIIFSDYTTDQIIQSLPTDEISIFLHTRWENNFQEKIQDQKIGIWIGPEGWWSEREINNMNKNNFIIARFWNRIMRTETAGMVMNFLLLHSKNNI